MSADHPHIEEMSMIERTFQDIPKGRLAEADQQSFLVSLGWSSGTTWEDLLRSKRVLIVSEAGAGKTHECYETAQRLWDAGEPAFYVELAGLATGDLRSLLDDEKEARIDAWLSSQSDIATFFLDSIDELKLTVGSFERALNRLKKGIGGQLGRARIVVTTRPIPFDEQLVRRLLPVPPIPPAEPPERTFARIAMGDHPAPPVEDDDEAAPDWRTVGLMPLSNDQIVEFARDQGVEDPGALLDDLEKRNAEEFARRPQDLIELCADWREHKRVRTHRDQVATNVRVKLQPRDDRREPAELSVDKAIAGASRLALAMMFTRRMTIRHSVASDDIEDQAALDPSIILSDWKPNERKALLERALFGFASYGRVRFHHRSVTEYLAAERLRELRNGHMTLRTLKRLLFAETRGKTIVRPSKRPIAGWLAIDDDGIFQMLRDNEPAVLFNEGDPESLSQPQRNQTLRAYAERYGRGGWRGLSVPPIQVHRFASPELADTVKELWAKGVESPDVRDVFLQLIGAGRIRGCADIAHGVARDVHAPLVERTIAVDALLAIRDSRLEDIASEVANADPAWPDKIVRGVVLRLFPGYLAIEQLCPILSKLEGGKLGLSDLSWQLPHLIADAKLDRSDLEALRDGLVALLSDGLRWQKDWPYIVCDRPHLSGALAATCVRGLKGSRADAWLEASGLALRIHLDERSNTEAHKALHERLTNLTADENSRLFWTADSLVRSLHTFADPWRRFSVISLHDGPVKLRSDRDLGWIEEALGDTTRSTDDRAMLLQAAMRLPPEPEQWREHVSCMKLLVSDQPSLLATIEERLKPSKLEKEHRRWEKRQAKRQKQEERRRLKEKAKWIGFWREVGNRPEEAFSSDRGRYTASRLWNAMHHHGEHGRTSEWNRRFIEEHFGKKTADRLRCTLMNIWRQDCPTLPSERPEKARRMYPRHWQLGLAGLYAEAEDRSWATKLTEEEAGVAARYAAIELNGLPLWMESLVEAHPKAVDTVLGNELNWELEEEPGADGHLSLLQDINYASETVAKLFLPRLRVWLNDHGDMLDDACGLAGGTERLRRVISTMLKHGDKDTRACAGAVARHRLREELPKEFTLVWLPTLMRVDPELGVSELEERLRTVEPEELSEAVGFFAVLFGDRHDAIDLKSPAFTPSLLLRLLRVAYRHVRPVDDARHEGVYTPDMRDHAQRARDTITKALLEAKGEDGWAAKLEMANDPLCKDFKDWIIAVAEESRAQEIDEDAFDLEQALALDKTGEARASTNEAMFAIMSDRLADLDEQLLLDDSPRELWAGITEEKFMRRAIARELTRTANGLYTVDQEAVTADEKETDIRLRSTVSTHEAVIELKRADGRSARDLRDTIQEQLVTKYMAAETSRSGCLLITLASDRKWKHPDNGSRIGPTELMSFLRQEACRLEETIGSSLTLRVHLLDLRPQLPTEDTGKKGRKARRST